MRRSDADHQSPMVPLPPRAPPGPSRRPTSAHQHTTNGAAALWAEPSRMATRPSSASAPLSRLTSAPLNPNPIMIDIKASINPAVAQPQSAVRSLRPSSARTSQLGADPNRPLLQTDPNRSLLEKILGGDVKGSVRGCQRIAVDLKIHSRAERQLVMSRAPRQRSLTRRASSTSHESGNSATYTSQDCVDRKGLGAAIQRIVEQYGKGVSVVKVLKLMRSYDVHLGFMVQRLQTQHFTSMNRHADPLRTGVTASNNAMSASTRRWPEILQMLRQVDMDSKSRRSLIARELQAMAEADLYTALQLDAQSQGFQEKECEAARDFDMRHMRYSGGALRAMATIKYDKSQDTSSAFRKGMVEVLRNRFVTPEMYDPFSASPPQRDFPPKRHVRRWRLENSIWAPRATFGNSKDLYEGRSLSTLLSIDWQVARMHHQLATFILRTQLTPGELSKLSKDMHPAAPEVQAVYDVLERHASTVYGAFYHYATVGKSFDGPDTEIMHVRHDAFMKFVEDCSLVSPDGSTGHFSTIWSVVDAGDRSTRRIDPYNKPSALNRHEWLQVLVRIAVHTLLRPRSHSEPIGNVADTIEVLCEHLEARLPPVALLSSDEFRRHFCYTEAVDRVLRKHESFLRMLYATYAVLGNDGLNDQSTLTSTSQHASHMSIGAWLEMNSNIGLVELGLVSVTQLMQAFNACRIRASTEYSATQEMRLRLLFFEDFCEALVRVAFVIALPTPDDVSRTLADDAGDFMIALLQGADDKFRQFVARRGGGWLGHPHQRIQGSLVCLLALMMRLIDANTKIDGLAEGSLSRSHLAAFANKRRGGAKLELPKATFNGSNIPSVVEEIRAHNFRVLSGVPAFTELNEEQIGLLLDSMSKAKFNTGDYVYEQGSFGDAFYLVTSGYANVIHVDPTDKTEEEVVLAQLAVSDCFGELALQRDQPRPVSIVATSTLDVLFITRCDFEAKLGCIGPLSALQLVKDEGVVVDSEDAQGQKPQPELKEEVTQAAT